MSNSSPHHLEALPPSFAATRHALHQLAFFALAPRRYECEGRLGLVALPGGFGTPWYDQPAGRERVRMRADELVVELGDEARHLRPTSLHQACEFLDVEYRERWFEGFHDPPAAHDAHAPLDVDPDAASALATWFAFGTAALEALRSTPGAVDPSTVQLWPEHFDPAVEVGSESDGTRASYGASPGDDAHDDPYLFVAPWGTPPDDPWFDDPAFGGASLSHGELMASDDPFTTAVAFLRRGHDLLGARRA